MPEGQRVGNRTDSKLPGIAPRSKALVEEVRQKHVQSEREKLRAKRRCKIVGEWYRSVQF